MERKIDTTVRVNDLKPGNYKYNYTLDGAFFSTFENEDFLDGNVIFNVTLEKTAHDTVFHFDFQGTIKSTCDRCLGELEVAVEGKQDLLVKFSDTEVSDNEDTVVLPEKATTIDLAQWMYEYVVVAMPMQKLHKEGECDPEVLKYLNTEEEQTEASEEIDPRWEALKQLKNED
ncbi:MAG: DUF177 domain-containing protein [Bacteroidales bacterium]|nr:DUF177 domain-containing protein [Bacteroidales bacterium]